MAVTKEHEEGGITKGLKFLSTASGDEIDLGNIGNYRAIGFVCESGADVVNLKVNLSGDGVTYVDITDDEGNTNFADGEVREKDISVYRRAKFVRTGSADGNKYIEVSLNKL